MTYKFQNRRIKKLLTGFATLVTCFYISACADDSAAMKNGILEAQSNSKNKTISLDINKFSKNKITKICIQNPYTPHKFFEERIGKSVQNFSEVDDHYFVLWVFYENLAPKQIKFHRWREISFKESESPGCVTASTVYLINLQLSLESDHKGV